VGVEANRDNSSGRGEALPLCPKCFAENPTVAVRCVNCGAYFTDRAATLPFETSIAGAWAIGEAVSAGRPSRVMLIGAWLLLLPWLLFALAASVSIHPRSAPVGLLAASIGLLEAAFIAFLLHRVTRNYRRGRSTRNAEGEAPGGTTRNSGS
jgi:hypothetical protein